MLATFCCGILWYILFLFLFYPWQLEPSMTLEMKVMEGFSLWVIITSTWFSGSFRFLLKTDALTLFGQAESFQVLDNFNGNPCGVTVPQGIWTILSASVSIQICFPAGTVVCLTASFCHGRTVAVALQLKIHFCLLVGDEGWWCTL